MDKLKNMSDNSRNGSWSGIFFRYFNMDIRLTVAKSGFSFFSQEGWKNFRWGASHMQYAILDASGGTSNGKPKCARRVKRHSSGVKHFLKGIKKNVGGRG